MTTTSENFVLHQFPQPARPPNSYDRSFQIQSTVYPQQQLLVDQSYVMPEPPSMVKEHEGERKLTLVDKLVNRVLDKCEKNVESQTQSTTSRGLPQQPVEEKLERFKVRTVFPQDVVKEDDKK